MRRWQRRNEDEDEFEDEGWMPFSSRRGRGFFDDFFTDVDEEIERMHKRMDRMFKSTIREELREPGEGGHFVYGFSMRVGPDGKPHVQEFGNTRPEFLGLRKLGKRLLGQGEEEHEEPEGTWVGGREPITDVIEGDKSVSVTVEMPGVEKEDIDLDVSEELITIKVDTDQRKYYKDVEMPCRIKPNTTRATYRNGVLDITVDRMEMQKKPRRKITVE